MDNRVTALAAREDLYREIVHLRILLRMCASVEIIGNHKQKNPSLFRDTMLRLIHSESLEYKELTRAA